MPDPDPDLSLVGLADQVRAYLGRIETMDAERRVLLLGLFEGSVSRLRARVRELYRQVDGEARAVLYLVALALGEPEDWERPAPAPAVCSPQHCLNGVACYAPACYGPADYGRADEQSS